MRCLPCVERVKPWVGIEFLKSCMSTIRNVPDVLVASRFMSLSLLLLLLLLLSICFSSAALHLFTSEPRSQDRVNVYIYTVLLDQAKFPPFR